MARRIRVFATFLPMLASGLRCSSLAFGPRRTALSQTSAVWHQSESGYSVNPTRSRPALAAFSDNDETHPSGEVAGPQDDSKSKNPLERLNEFLDTPILDANNRSDQGPLAEVLKDFVRSSPEVAQLAFSVVVIGLLVGLVRLFTSL